MGGSSSPVDLRESWAPKLLLSVDAQAGPSSDWRVTWAVVLGIQLCSGPGVAISSCGIQSCVPPGI